ncbi:MAG: hypothetical protein JRN20_13165 [Nitrososphaerota archaeon]|nr:hypothetical protein [Nitrososphaerota archaeon]
MENHSESGAWILERRDTGLFTGMLYAYPKVGSWDGSLKIPALFLNEWYSNMGDKRQLLHFEYRGRRFSGTYYKSNSDLVRICELADNERGRAWGQKLDKISWHRKSGLNGPSK